MQRKSGALALVFGAAVAALCTAACKKSPDGEPTRVDRTELRSATLEVEPTGVAPDAVSPPTDFLAAVRREKLDLRTSLEQEIVTLNGELADLPQQATSARVLLQRRTKLEADLAAVDHADERGWDLLKANVERDLADQPAGGF